MAARKSASKPFFADELQAEIKRLQRALDEERQEHAVTRAKLAERDGYLGDLRRAEVREKKAIEEIAGLKDELHRMTVHIARLEGYRDRVLEFDPVTQKQAYRDEVSSHSLDERREFYGAPMNQARDPDFGYPSTRRDAPAPWYRRG